VRNKAMESLPAGDSYKDIEIKSFIFSITFVMIDRSVKNRFQNTIRQILKNPIKIIKKTKEYKLHGHRKHSVYWREKEACVWRRRNTILLKWYSMENIVSGSRIQFSDRR